MQIYKAIFNPGFTIDRIPPVTRANIITTLINFINPDLLVKSVTIAENMVKITVKK